MEYQYNILLLFKINFMAAKKRRGKPLKKESEKVKVMAVYLTLEQKKKITDRFGTLTNALRTKVLEEF